MMKIGRILVAIKQPDARSLPAVLKAAQIAHASGAELELFHALSEPVYAELAPAIRTDVERLEQQQQLQARRKLEALAERLRLHSIRIEVSVVWDRPVYEAIVRRALESKADLIVAQRYHGRHTVAGLMRLTDWELVKLSPIPVLLVKSTHAYRHPAILAAIDPGHRFAKPSQLDRVILRAAGTLCRALRGKLHVVHTYGPLPLAAVAEGMTRSMLDAVERQARRAAQARFSRELRGTKVARSRRYLLPSHPIDGIGQAARHSRSAIVVMGTISRSGLKRVIIGNTAERILDELTCDVLVVKPPTFRGKVSLRRRGARLVLTSPLGRLGIV
jgi:universal stress protein E